MSAPNAPRTTRFASGRRKRAGPACCARAIAVVVGSSAVTSQDAQRDGEREPGDAARILRFLGIERNAGGFTRGQRAETEDDGDVVDAGADDDADTNVCMAANDCNRGGRVVGDISPDGAEQAQYAYREAKHFAERFKPARKPGRRHHHDDERDKKEQKRDRKQGEEHQ